MPSPEPCDEPANCTPASEGDIAVFPADVMQDVVPPSSIQVGPLVPLAAAFSLGIAIAPALPVGSGG